MDNDRLNDQLYEVIASLKSKEEAEAFLKDLCTYNELDYMAQRIEAAHLLLENKTYNEITETVDISTATLSRVNRCIKHSDGYNTVLKRFFEK